MANEKRLDLIDRQALGIGRCNPDAFPLQNRGYVAGWNGVISLLEQAPTVDAVEVVRCKDCKHLNVLNRKEIYAHCPKTNTVFLPFELDTRTHFCSYGERREGE